MVYANLVNAAGA